MLPTGIILLWYGSIGSIPTGYVLCNGANGTPDLRNKFLVGAGDSYAVGANGGNVNHTHPFTGDGHFHTIGGGVVIGAGTFMTDETDSSPATGTTDAGSSLPPYHGLAYIMKT